MTVLGTCMVSSPAPVHTPAGAPHGLALWSTSPCGRAACRRGRWPLSSTRLQIELDAQSLSNRDLSTGRGHGRIVAPLSRRCCSKGLSTDGERRPQRGPRNPRFLITGSGAGLHYFRTCEVIGECL